ncbi:MAG: hypothetical protein KKA07_08605 [Bacteroidetes bacterium]|nr:hypothetical protein [Bacteroidota bacterium]MBU1719122.1 hypothetical protein [Bacteroidota bacterium]
MKTKRQLLFLIMFAGTVAFIVSGCKKYPDGPTISLSSRTDRVANTWNVENYKINGTDYTSLVSGYVQTFSKDGNYSFNWGILGGTGKWSFQSNDDEILINGVDNQPSITLYILKLEKKQFWYYYMDGSDRQEFHLIQ